MQAQDDRKIKGSVVMDMVKLIRALPDLAWDRYLTDEDRRVVNSMVMPTDWYPIESYMRMGLAVFRLAAGGDKKAVRNFGRQAMEGLFESAYRPFLDKGNPEEAIRKFFDLRRSLFNFSTMKTEKKGDGEVESTVSGLGLIKEGLDVFALLLEAHLERLAELNGAAQVRVESREEPDHEGKKLVFRVVWK